MQLDFSPAEEAWRSEVVEFLEAEIPGDYRGETAYEDDEAYEFTRSFARKLGARNWLSLAWPEEYSGQQRKSKTEQAILMAEIGYHRGPFMNFQSDPASALISYGTDAQRDRWLEDLRTAEIGFCNGLTEPEAGSDLAALSFSAVEEGDEFVLNGEKIFNTRAHRIEYMMVAARTTPDATKYRGIRSIVCDLETPGVTVVPKMDLGGTNLSWIYFDNVRVPKDNLIGTKDQAWYEALSVDLHSRPGSGPYSSQRTFDDFVQFCNQEPVGGRLLIDAEETRLMLAEFAIELEVQRQLYWRTIWAREQRESGNDVIGEKIGGGLHQASSSVLGLWQKEWTPRFMHAAYRLLGPYGQLKYGDRWAPMLGEIERGVRLSHSNHAHGTPEILKNVMAHRGLDMPRS